MAYGRNGAASASIKLSGMVVMDLKISVSEIRMLSCHDRKVAHLLVPRYDGGNVLAVPK